MHHLSILAAVVALAGQSLAAPVAEVVPEGAFSVTQVATGKKLFKNGPSEVMKTYKKFNKPIPAVVAAAAAAATQSGSVTATPAAYDSEYLCPVTVGSNTLQLDFDTGSSDLWVFSNLMPASQQGSHHIYSTASGASTGQTWKISYGDGSGASGRVFADKVNIGGVTATGMAVEAATSVSSSFTGGSDDGLVGLAFPSINTCSPTQCVPFMQKVASTLPSNLFTASLKKGKAGTYDFGYINTARYTGTIGYTSINTANGFWEFTASGYKVGTASGVSTTLDVIADTGTTLLYLPSAVCNAYYSAVSGAKLSSAAGGYVFPCSSTLPSLSILISGVYRTIPGTYLNYAPYTSSTCFGGLQSDAGIGFSILGDIFLKSQFVVFDVGNVRIGLATSS